jgi:hypothetical protein
MSRHDQLAHIIVHIPAFNYRARSPGRKRPGGDHRPDAELDITTTAQARSTSVACQRPVER